MSQVVICPTVTAYDTHEYRRQMEVLEKFASRIHIDLMDGLFTPNLSPDLKHVWWPDNLTADIHLMYQNPANYLSQFIQLKPRLVVIHIEADGDHRLTANKLHEAGIKAGLAILQKTSAEAAYELLPDFDHVMVYSGNLGEHGGQADLSLLDKVRELRSRFPRIEISWDGGINDQNARQLVEAGVDVLNLGGFLQKSEDPAAAYNTITRIII
jgi:ribulose-phosphate 3-epimerase